MGIKQQARVERAGIIKKVPYSLYQDSSMANFRLKASEELMHYSPSRIFLAVLMYDRAAIDRITTEATATEIANQVLTSAAKDVPALAAANPINPIGKSLLNRFPR
jgi:hypothetical protein